ncbi:MAG: type II toxin-antitoxin system VapC family toxin [Rhizobiaceae bacterium]
MYLVDTNIISLTSPTAKTDHTIVVPWIRQAEPSIFLSTVTAAEVVAGIAKVRRLGALAKAANLDVWWTEIMLAYSKRFLPFDLEVAGAAGVMVDAARGHQPGFPDIAIAATAKVHGLTVLTANVRHFEPLGVPVINPFVALPDLPPSA